MTDDFFEPLPEPPEHERYEPPIWSQPPVDELAALLPDLRLLARSELGVVVRLSHIDVYRQGCSFRIRSSADRRDDMDEGEWSELHEIAMHGDGFRHRHRHGAIPDGLLRFGVQFRDGCKATTTGGPWDAPVHHDHVHDDPVLGGHVHDDGVRGPVLSQHGGGGSGSDRVATSTRSLWLWPLPPPEPFELVVSWPAVGVELTRVELSGRDIAEAASRAAPLWPDGAA